jgi:hypothetical protein
MALLSQHNLEHRDDSGQGRFSDRPPIRVQDARPEPGPAHLPHAGGRIRTRLPRHAPDHGRETAARSIASAPTVDRRPQPLRRPAQLLAGRIAGPPTAKRCEGRTERLHSGEAALRDALDDQRNRGWNAKHRVISMRPGRGRIEDSGSKIALSIGS